MKKGISLICLTIISISLFSQTPEVLSPKLNKFQNLRDFCISADKSEAYFTVQSPNGDLSQIICVQNENWDSPVLLAFCDNYSYLEPFLSYDGKRLYFASNRPKYETDTLTTDFDIWYVQRKDEKHEWSKPINMGSKVNSENDEFYPTLAENNNLYITMDSKTGPGKDDIYYCVWSGTEYSEPVILNNNINTEGYEFNAFISKDESFLIFTKYNTNDGFGSGDLYLSEKDEKGEWKEPKNMGNIINTKYMEYCPFYDTNTGTLYFTSRRSNLIPKKFKDLNEFLDYISGSENGLSRIYKYKIQL